VSELGYNLSLSDKAKAFIAEKGFDRQFRNKTAKRAIQNMLKMHLPKRLLPLKLLQVMIFSWTLKKNGIDHQSQMKNPQKVGFFSQ
jgi:ATP-dependent Clp protease ATP-binding subunit ClpA